MELGDNRKSRPVCGGGLSSHRSTTSNLDVSERPGISHRLAMGEIGGSDYPCFPVSNDFVASNFKTDHSGFLSPSDPFDYVVGDCHSRNTIYSVLEAIEKDANLLDEPLAAPSRTGSRESGPRLPLQVLRCSMFPYRMLRDRQGPRRAHRPDILREDELCTAV